MSVCTYDNPQTMQRECWADGRLLCAYDAGILEPVAKHLIPSQLFFFGANVGPWETGQLIGDPSALPTIMPEPNPNLSATYS